MSMRRKQAMVAYENKNSADREKTRFDYVESVREHLRRMGSPDPDVDTDRGLAFIDAQYAAKTAPAIAAAVLYGSLHHTHLHNAPGKHVEMLEKPCGCETGAAEEFGHHEQHTFRGVSYAVGFDGSGWRYRLGKVQSGYFPSREAAILAAQRKIGAEPGYSMLVEGAAAPAALEARDSAPGVCQPFTRIVRDPAKLSACMARSKKPIENSRDLFDLVRPDLEKRDQETFVVVCLDMRGALRDFVEIAVGQRHRVAVDIEDILAAVIMSRCDGVALLHNHPSGIAEPSRADGSLTRKVQKAMRTACPNVRLLDHCVVGLGQYYSFADNGWSDEGKVVKV